MRRATFLHCTTYLNCSHFYPRSPCGERPNETLQNWQKLHISIHALLAESDNFRCSIKRAIRNFYPRSPCGERHLHPGYCALIHYFYPRSPCGERQSPARVTPTASRNFYPRSPCGERQFKHLENRAQDLAFLSTLSLRRATLEQFKQITETIFLSTLSLRRATILHMAHLTAHLFLSTLSLRRATRKVFVALIPDKYFYPRSPCGERLMFLLSSTKRQKFLSTLSLRRATGTVSQYVETPAFLSTLSLRRATNFCRNRFCPTCISIHALLAESDSAFRQLQPALRHFYPRSPCGERPPRGDSCYLDNIISIHALLAESDVSH